MRLGTLRALSKEASHKIQHDQGRISNFLPFRILWRFEKMSSEHQGLRSLRSLHPWLLSIALSALSKEAPTKSNMIRDEFQISNLKFQILL